MIHLNVILHVVVSNYRLVTALFNNMRTLKFKSQPTNAFFATVNQMISQYLYRNVQFSKASLNGVLFYESILRREETGVPGGNPRSQVEID